MKHKVQVSCLTATYGRLVKLKESVRCFCDQTHARKQLVIACGGDARYQQAVSRFVATLGRDDIKLLLLSPHSRTLGEIRNRLLDEADGDIVCQWDDDDLSHPLRLSTQLKAMEAARARACCFTDHLQYFESSHELFWVDWTRWARSVLNMFLPGTLMMYRDEHLRYPETGPLADRGEDSVFLEKVYRSSELVPLSGSGYLYVYRHHGGNTFDEAHHRALTRRPCTPVFARRYGAGLADALQYYRLPKPVELRLDAEEPLVVVGHQRAQRSRVIPRIPITDGPRPLAASR